MSKSGLPQPKNPIPQGGSYGWVILILMILLVGQIYLVNQKAAKLVEWNTVESEYLAKDEVEKIVVINREYANIYIKQDLIGTDSHEKIYVGHQGPHYYVNIGSVETFEQKLKAATQKYQIADIPVSYVKQTNWLSSILAWVLPIFLILIFWYYIISRVRGAGGMGNQIFNYGQSKAREFRQENKHKITFDDVAGLENAKLEVREIIQFLKSPENYTRLGAKIPKGVMLAGPPGTGKTLLAKAVAGEANVPFFSISGSEFVEMFVGVGASRVRDLFKNAKSKSPSIIFIDEIDAVGRSRGKAFSLQSNDERENTLNQLLTEMDGFESNSGVIVMAATNRPDILDAALLRPGRFDRHIYLELPSVDERNAIFKVHLKPLKLADDIDVEHLAQQTPGFSGADISNICNEAALIAARDKKAEVEAIDFDRAIDRVIGGLERKGKLISQEEKEIIAHHEAGHALVSWFLEHTDDLVKVTIVPRGKALGAAWYKPEERVILTESQLADRLSALLGGRAAESIIFEEVSSGALDDLEKATKQAYTMVAYYGLNKEMGNVSFYDSTGQYEQSLRAPYSDATAQMIDLAVRELIEQAYIRAKEILKTHRTELISIAQLLLEKETILNEDVQRILGERPDYDEPITTKLQKSA